MREQESALLKSKGLHFDNWSEKDGHETPTQKRLMQNFEHFKAISNIFDFYDI